MTRTSSSRLGSLFLPALVAAALAAPGPAQAQLGVGGGLNFNSLDDIEADGARANYERSTGYNAGVFYDFGLGPLNLRPGVFYHRLGRLEFPEGAELDLSAVEVPLDVRFQPLPIPVINPYLLGAPVLTFGRGDGPFSEAVEDVNLTADVGVGLQVSLPGAGLSLMPELRYSMGVTDYLSDSFQVGGTTVRPSSDARRHSKLMLRLNVLF